MSRFLRSFNNNIKTIEQSRERERGRKNFKSNEPVKIFTQNRYLKIQIKSSILLKSHKIF